MYYIYGHRDPKTNDVFYIGKGKKYRAYSINSRNNIHFNKLKKLQREGFSIKHDVVFYIEKNIENQNEAYTKEIYYISQFKRHHTLLNISAGGVGGIGSSGRYGLLNHNWVDLNIHDIINYLKQGFKLKQIASLLGCSVALIKNKCYPTTSIQLFCKQNNIVYKNHMSKNIHEKDFQLQILQGKTNKEIAKYFKVNLNYFKIKFYPTTTLKEYCNANNIPYVDTKSKSKNGNYKEINYSKFVKLVQGGISLTAISKQLGVCPKLLISRYKERFNVKNWQELKSKLQG